MLFPELLVPLILLFWAGAWVLIFTPLRACAGYLHFVRTFYRQSSSCCNSWGLGHIVLVLWCRVSTTLYFDDIVWWLSHCKYKSVWVGFLYTVVLRLLSCYSVTRISKKGMEPSVLESWLENWMLWSMELMWYREFLLCVHLMTVNISSAYLFHREWGVVMYWWL